MDIKRTVLWVIFFMSAVMLFDNWQRDHGRPSMFFPSAVPTKTVGSAAPGTTTPGTQAADLPPPLAYPAHRSRRVRTHPHRAPQTSS
jgi:YidC/Oxa1 family membrane protein insertase